MKENINYWLTINGSPENLQAAVKVYITDAETFWLQGGLLSIRESYSYV